MTSMMLIVNKIRNMFNKKIIIQSPFETFSIKVLSRLLE